jgi:hypothetical protein
MSSKRQEVRAMMTSGSVTNRNTFADNAENARLSIREAQRILGETEGEVNSGLFSITRLQGSGREDAKGRVWPYTGCVALAEALGGALSELDKLAEGAWTEALNPLGPGVEWRFLADMEVRNRATDAALEGR